MTDAFELGKEAYCRGDDITMNPYCESDSQHDEWDDGYRQELFNSHPSYTAN